MICDIPTHVFTEIVAKVKEKSMIPFRPPITPAPNDVHPGMLELMTECWSESPMHRPSFADVKRTIARLNKGKYVPPRAVCSIF